jgi:hypothetical protein
MLLKNGVFRFVFFILTPVNGVKSEEGGVDQTSEFDINL